MKIFVTGVGGQLGHDVWRGSVPEILVCAVMLALSIINLATNTYNPFIYFRF